MTRLRNLAVLVEYWRTPRKLRLKTPEVWASYRHCLTVLLIVLVLVGVVVIALFCALRSPVFAPVLLPVSAAGLFAIFQLFKSVLRECRAISQQVSECRASHGLCVSCLYPLEGRLHCTECGMVHSTGPALGKDLADS